MSVLGGAAVDRWPRKVTAVVNQDLLGVVAFTTAVLVALDMLGMTSLMVLAAVTGTIATVDGPATSPPATSCAVAARHCPCGSRPPSGGGDPGPGDAGDGGLTGDRSVVLSR